MSDVKTKPNNESVNGFIDLIESEQKRDDSRVLLRLMSEITNAEPTMWGSSIIGFGSYHYKYKSGREGDWMLTGFSPRKQALTVYLMSGFSKMDEHLTKLGKHKIGKSCLYIKTLDDIDINVLKAMIVDSIEHVKEVYG